MVPRSLHSSLMARLDQLSAGKEVAQIGAVVGREFSFDMMQALTGLPPQRLELALAELTQSGIIIAHGQSPLATYTFKHALVQDAAYTSLLRERRRAIHLRLAEELEQEQEPDAAEPHLIARHFAEAGTPEKAVHYYRQAAIRATGRSALGEMVSHLRNALIQVGLVPQSQERDRLELHLQLLVGSALIDFQGSGSEGVRNTFERARELCLALDEVKQLPRVYDGLVLNYHFTHSQPQKIVQYTREILEVCERTNDPQALLMARRAGALANLLLGRFAAAREDMQRIIDMYQLDRDGPHAGMSTRDPKVSTCTLLGICLTILGFPEAGAATSMAGVEHAKTLNHPISLNLGLRRACVQGMLVRDSLRVLSLSQELAALREAYETYKGSWEGTLFHDWAQHRGRPVAEHLEGMQALLRQLDTTQNWALLPLYMTCARRIERAVGRHRCRHDDVAPRGGDFQRDRQPVVRRGDHAAAGVLHARSGGGHPVVSREPGKGERAGRQALGAAHGREPRRIAARPRRSRRGAGCAEAGLRLVHRGLGERGSGRRPRLAQGAWLTLLPSADGRCRSSDDEPTVANAVVVLVTDEYDGQNIARDQRREGKCTEEFVHCCLFFVRRTLQHHVRGSAGGKSSAWISSGP